MGKKRFFEKEIVDSTLPVAKPERRFSFLSEDEVNKLRQEEERKIANLTSEQLMNLSRLDDVEEADEEEEEDAPKLTGVVPITITTVPTAQHPSIVRTAKAERRLKEKMQREGLELSEEEKKLSPAEQRVLQAKKRAAWREARLKSLEQDAMQAELVIKKMSELADTSSASLSSSFRNLSLNSQDDNGNNNQSAVDYSNNNEIVSVETPECIREDNESENEDAADNNEPLTTPTGNIATSTGNSRRKKKSKKLKNR